VTLDLFATDSTGAATVREAQRARDAGIAQAEATAGETWAREADAALREFLETHGLMHVDAFHTYTDAKFVRKAFGPVVLRAVKAGWMVGTDEYRPSTFSNLAPKRVWSSRLFKGARP
jgi:hypothetical protein